MESALQRFEACARDFCNWCIEQSKTELPANDLLIRLVDLYRAALELPPHDGNLEDDYDVDLSRIEFSKESLPFDYYWEVFDPFVESQIAEKEVVTGSLSDDLGDILQEVGEGLTYWDAGRRDLAHWNWQFSFSHHWREHATSAIRALDRFISP